MNGFTMAFIGLAGFSVFLIGVSKTGLGGAGGNLAVPLMALAFSAQESLAILLPVLCVADLFSIGFYRFRWDYNVIKMLVPGTIIGIIAGSLLLGFISDVYLKRAIGLVAIGFVIAQFLRYKIMRHRGAYMPKYWHGIVFGEAAGAVSTITHAAGPIISFFLLPMELKKEIFVATTVFYFAIVNYLKLIPYTFLGIMDFNSALFSMILIPFVPLGTYAGFRLNRVISSRHFTLIIYLLLLVTGLQLITGLNLIEILLISN